MELFNTILKYKPNYFLKIKIKKIAAYYYFFHFFKYYFVIYKNINNILIFNV